MSARILVVEDEPEIADFLRRGFTMEGYTVVVATDGIAALAAAQTNQPDIVILDIMLPALDGMEVTKRLRLDSQMPIIMLTARESIADRVAGLEYGADDYLTKPFAFEELLARVQVQLRRRRAKQTGEVLRFGTLYMDVAGHSVKLGEQLIDLTAKEYEVLELFLRHAGQVLTREVIYERVWGYDFGADSNVIEVYMSALRQKLERTGAARMLHTIRGVGYILREQQ
jgi:two-component system, OmpR family, response regulator MprA